MFVAEDSMVETNDADADELGEDIGRFVGYGAQSREIVEMFFVPEFSFDVVEAVFSAVRIGQPVHQFSMGATVNGREPA